jgi:hypothetical protein
MAAAIAIKLEPGITERPFYHGQPSNSSVR